MDKATLRDQLKSQYASRVLEEYTPGALDGFKRATHDLEFRHILAYAPDERYEVPFIEQLMNERQTLSFYFPKVVSKELVFYKVASFSDLETGAFGLMEPPTSTIWPETNPQETIALIPALGATLRGDRLGRGRGYYDRFLSRMRNRFHRTLCLLPDFAVQEDLPIEKHDVPVDVVISVKS